MNSPISENWPLVYGKDLCVCNKTANIAIITYWSNIDYIKGIITEIENVNTIGNAYSKMLCLNPILVNLSSNRYIRYLILCGDDKEKAENTIDLFFSGNSMDLYDEKYFVALQHIKSQITVIKCRVDSLNNTLSLVKKTSPYNESPIDICQILIPKSSVIWNSHDSGYMVRSNDMTKLFIKINQKIMTRGKSSKIRTTNIREINNMITIYDGPLLDELDDCFGIDKTRIQEYYEEFKSRHKSDDQPYTYSSRLFVDNLKQELTSEPLSKRSYSPIFYPDDYILKSNPCAVGMHLMVVGKKLHATVFFRSNDMFRAWPLNMLGFRYQQEIISNEMGYEMGPTTLISSSAHIYSENWKDAIEISKKIIEIENDFSDPEGYFICSKEEDDTLLINYFSNDGKIQWMWQVPTNQYEKLIYDVSMYVSDPQHAGYLAKEITKLAHNIYTENSVNKMLSDVPSCTYNPNPISNPNPIPNSILIKNTN